MTGTTGLSDRAELLAAYDAQLRPAEAEMFPPGAYVEDDGPVRRVVGAHEGFIAAPQCIDLPEADLGALIDRQRDFFAARGESVEWKTRGHDRPVSLTTFLSDRGFVAAETETVMVGLAASCAGLPVVPPPVELVDVVRRPDIERIAAMEGEIWNEDRSWLVGELAGRAANGSVAVSAAMVAGCPVSAAWIVWVPGTEFAYLAGGGTLEAWRRRGIYRALVARRANLAVQRGVRYLAVDASADSRPVLERLGLLAVTTTTPYVWTPPPA